MHRKGTEEERCDVNLLSVTFPGSLALRSPYLHRSQSMLLSAELF